MVQYSEFDSKIFGMSIGRDKVSGLTSQGAIKIHHEQKEQNLDLVFIQDSNFDFCSMHLLPWNFLRLSDVKVRLYTSEFPDSAVHAPDIYFTQEYSHDDIPVLFSITSQIAELSQYCKRFGRATAIELYHQWVLNSLSGSVADYTYFVKSEKNGKVVGFVAIKLNNGDAEATLVAVDQNVQGKGLGRFILKNVLHDLGQLKVRCCYVGTQLTNKTAFSFYNSIGFRFDSYRVDIISERV